MRKLVFAALVAGCSGIVFGQASIRVADRAEASDLGQWYVSPAGAFMMFERGMNVKDTGYAALRLGRDINEVLSVELGGLIAPAIVSDPGRAKHGKYKQTVHGFTRNWRGVGQIYGGTADALIHLAAHPSPHGRPDHETFNNNAVSSYNALSIGVQLGMKRICQASSVNAIGTSFSRRPRYDYLPLDEKHPTYAEDPYALSKWVCETQADSFCRLHADLAIASMRFSWIVESRAAGIAIREGRGGLDKAVKELWGYTDLWAAARACVEAVAGSSWTGSETFYLVAPRTMATRPSADLVAEHYPDAELKHSLVGDEGLYDCSKAERLLGWRHPVE